MIKIKNLHKKINNRTIVNIKNLTFPDTGIFYIVGKSGCGKTTLINCISGLDDDYDGSIIVNETILKTLPEEQKSAYLSENIGYIFQKPFLLDGVDRINNVTLGDKKLNKKCKSLIRDLNIQSTSNYVESMSGGEKQRISFARSLIKQKPIVLCDEPTSGLDIESKKILLEKLHEISKTSLVIIITHDKTLISNSDHVFKMVDGKITNSLDIDYKKRMSKKGDARKIGLSFCFQYVRNMIKKRKIRNAISLFLVTLSLISTGTVLLLKDGVENTIVSSLNSMYEEDEIVVNKRHFSNNSNVGRTLLSEELDFLKNAYHDSVHDYGYYYENNMDNFFNDANEFQMIGKYKYSVLEGFGAESINTFRVFDNTIRDQYVEITKNLNNEQIIISLNNDQMVSLCLFHQIPKTFDSLFSFIKEGKLSLTFFAANNGWGYADERTFEVVGFIKEQGSFIYHTNKKFNVEVFENDMQLPSVLDINNVYYPRTLIKKSYITLKENYYGFLNKVFKDEILKKYVFEKFCINEAIDSYYEGVYLITTQEDYFDTNFINSLLSYNYNDFYFSNSFGYMAGGNKIVNGFVFDIYFTSNFENINLLENAYNNMTDSFGYVDVANIDTMEKGGFSGDLSNNIRFRLADNHAKAYLKNPYTLCISSALAKKLDVQKNQIIYCFAIKNKYINSLGNITYEFENCEFEVVDIINNDDLVIYHDNYWTIGLCRDVLKMNYQMYKPISMILKNKKGDNLEETVKKLNSTFLDYKFTTTLSTIISDLESMIHIITIILMIFSIVSVLMTIVLLIFVCSSLVFERRKDYSVLIALGVSRKETTKLVKTYLVTMFLLGIISSMVCLVFISFGLSKTVENTFHFSSNFYIPIIPTCAVILEALLCYLIISHFVKNDISKINVCLEMRK